MISIIYSTHKDQKYNELFQTHLKKSIGIKNFEILEYQNNNEFSLSQIYNRGLKESKFNIVVCIHNDIELENGWGRKLLKDFENNPDYGIIGKAGSCYFPESGVYWERMHQTMVGQVYHHPIGQKKSLSVYSSKFNFLIPVITIDGLFIAFDKTKIKHEFDESMGMFHFYDHLFCLPNYLDGVKIGVTSSFDITHQSVGMPNQEFFETKEKFVEKYKSVLPLDLKPKEILVEKVKPYNKKVGKTAIIIPHKNNLEVLTNCLNSWVQNCDISKFDIFIADTGSNPEEKEEIKKYISNYPSWKLIEYSFYNFSKINNDVVKNHINDEYEFLLFCNNDIIILNDVLSIFLNEISKNHFIGTLGARLHFEDKTIQHNGILIFINKKTNVFTPSHINFGSYYNFSKEPVHVMGNTAALCFTRKNLFVKSGMFNESYIECFEDFEYNLKMLLDNKINILCGNAVAIHLESKTRGQNPEKFKRMSDDMGNNLVPFINNNLIELRKKINHI